MFFLKLYRQAKRFIRREHAVTMVEYTVMLTIVVAVMLSAIEILGPTASDTFLDTSNALDTTDN